MSITIVSRCVSVCCILTAWEWWDKENMTLLMDQSFATCSTEDRFYPLALYNFLFNVKRSSLLFVDVTIWHRALESSASWLLNNYTCFTVKIHIGWQASSVWAEPCLWNKMHLRGVGASRTMEAVAFWTLDTEKSHCSPGTNGSI